MFVFGSKILANMRQRRRASHFCKAAYNAIHFTLQDGLATVTQGYTSQCRAGRLGAFKLFKLRVVTALGMAQAGSTAVYYTCSGCGISFPSGTLVPPDII